MSALRAAGASLLGRFELGAKVGIAQDERDERDEVGWIVLLA
jgi:hypothetical protein